MVPNQRYDPQGLSCEEQGRIFVWEQMRTIKAMFNSKAKKDCRTIVALNSHRIDIASGSRSPNKRRSHDRKRRFIVSRTSRTPEMSLRGRRFSPQV